MLRKYALTVVFLFVVCGAAAQLPDDEYLSLWHGL